MGLTVFQQKAVCNAYHQLTREGGSGRFLIADEVGLGKTIIAREIIRKFLEKTSKRAVTVVYICSNQLLARKNLGKLTPKNIADWDIESYPASRLSLLALDHPHLINPRSKAKEGKICYFYALTPGTSLSITSGSGTVRERMMLYLLSGGNFDKELDPDAPEDAPKLVKTYGMHKVKVDKSSNNNADDALEVYKGWETIYEDIRNNDPAQSKNPWIFLRNLFADPKIIEELAQSIERLKNQVRSKEKIFEQRKLLAQFGASLLKPDLVIFDEFQNYENIFIEKKRGGYEEELAARAELDIINTVFAKLKPKYLLLSATPFAPLTMNDEISRGEVSLPSCDAFTRLVEWLVRAEDGKFAKQWKDYAELFKRYCRNPDESQFEPVKERKEEVEQVVRSVMSRTERDASRLRDLVQEIDKTTSVLAGRTVDRKYMKYIFKSRQGEPYTTRLLEFEKYALRPLSAMRDDYTFIKAKERKNNPDCFLAGAKPSSDSLEKVMRHPYFQRLDQALGEDRIDYPLLLWMPPTVPFYKLKYPFDAAHENGFSKILIFSAWRYIPRMISAAMSNHVERKIWENNAIPKKLEAYHFFVPNVAGEVNLNADARLLLDADILKKTEIEKIFSSPAKSVNYALHKLIPEIGGYKQLETVCIAWSTKIAYALLQRMLRSDGVIILRKTWDKTDPDLREMLRIEIEKGKKYPPPEKLAALYCYAGCFSAVAYEYLYLLNQESHAEKTIDRISEICRNFYQTLKLRVHPIQLDFSEGSGEKKISSERINLHFADCFSEREKISEGTDSNNQSKERSVLPQILETLYKDLVIKNPNAPSADNEKALPQIRKYLKLKEDSPTDDEDSAQENAPIRNDTLQSAFNSPFKPFVLTTTSIGQEGLDFHWYCRKIMHWNLPGNPVKFDQREGRINRFCSFALRQILTKTKECSCEFSWPELFQKFQKKDSGGNGMIPMWLPPPNENEATSAARPDDQDKIDKALDRRIERIVPFFPLSREHLWLDNLIKLQGIYRMVIGQPHQEELLSLLRDLSEEKRQQIKELTISLAPKYPWEKALRKKRKSFSPKTGRRFR